MDLYKVCPKCKQKYTQHSAISRIDNKTNICPTCGIKEALIQFITLATQLAESWEGRKNHQVLINEEKDVRFGMLSWTNKALNWESPDLSNFSELKDYSQIRHSL